MFKNNISCEEIFAATQQIVDSNPGLTSGITLPDCDEDGNYTSKQCTEDACVCVDVLSGIAMPHSDFKSTWNIDCDHCVYCSYAISQFSN